MGLREGSPDIVEGVGLFRLSCQAREHQGTPRACTNCRSGKPKENPHSPCVGQKCQHLVKRITLAEILRKYSQGELCQEMLTKQK